MTMKDGFTIIPAMLCPGFAHAIKYSIVSALETCRATYDNPKRGTIKFEAIPGLLDRCLTPRVRDTFGSLLGAWAILDENKQTIILSAGKYLRGTTWHQECHTIPDNALICWISLDDGAGDKLPGLSMVRHPFMAPVDELMRDYIEEAASKEQFLETSGYEIVTPVLNAGDAVLLNAYTAHKTYVVDTMQDAPRFALKITAVPV